MACLPSENSRVFMMSLCEEVGPDSDQYVSVEKADGEVFIARVIEVNKHDY